MINAMQMQNLGHVLKFQLRAMLKEVLDDSGSLDLSKPEDKEALLNTLIARLEQVGSDPIVGTVVKELRQLDSKGFRTP